MCTTCDNCGQRTSEIKTGGKINEFGKKIKINVKKIEDLNLEMFKSPSCTINIPEIDFEFKTLTSEGGIITTVQGLIKYLIDNFKNNTQFYTDSDNTSSYKTFFNNLNDYFELNKTFTLILDDPLGNSFIWSHIDKDNNNIAMLEYTRTKEQNED